MKPVDIEKVRGFLDRRAKQHKKLLMKRLDRAQRDFDRIIQRIINKYDPLRIYQWGSLLHPEDFSEISDIDIAVVGSKLRWNAGTLSGDRHADKCL